jgi:2'-5' RNA ligase
MPQYAKYYIAIVPEGEVQVKATDLKLAVKERFQAKYALKSPAHITLKMPFRWNEAKEEKLISQLSGFFIKSPGFQLILKGIGRFGRRVIFIKVQEDPELMKLQQDLKFFCKTELKFIEELSDKAYRPHITLVSKDLKNHHFDDCLDFLQEQGFEESIKVPNVALLKKGERQWEVIQRFPLS